MLVLVKLNKSKCPVETKSVIGIEIDKQNNWMERKSNKTTGELSKGI